MEERAPVPLISEKQPRLAGELQQRIIATSSRRFGR
jgi:hypothetical protein